MQASQTILLLMEIWNTYFFRKKQISQLKGRKNLQSSNSSSNLQIYEFIVQIYLFFNIN